MKDQIISYREMCDQEGIQTLQRGMNYRLNNRYSVILMSQRRNAPYKDSTYEDGITIEYEGHDIPRTNHLLNPKTINQPLKTETGKLTQNGLFVKAVEEFKINRREPELVRVYEKIFSGVWSEKGFFRLIDYKVKRDESREVFRFILQETNIEIANDTLIENMLRPRTRIIPSEIKKIVWGRDKGRCVICGATDELHFDHDLPFSKGGTSINAINVKILCARHNLEKSDNIE